jgi:WD40 repeat protein
MLGGFELRALTTVSSANGQRLLACLDLSGTIRLWDVATGDRYGEPFRHPDGGLALATVPGPGSNDHLLSAGESGTIQRWDPFTGEPVGPQIHLPPAAGEPHQYSGWIYTLAVLARAGKPTLVAAAGTDGIIHLLDLDSGQPAGVPISGHTGWIRAVAFVHGSGGWLLASAGEDRAVRLWYPETCEAVGLPLTGHTGVVRSLASFRTPAGTTVLVSAGQDDTIRLWDPAAGEPLGQPIPAAHGRVLAVTVFPASNGETLVASAGDDLVVRHWHPGTRTLVAEHLAGDQQIRALAVVPGPDGAPLVAAAGDAGAVDLWNPVTGRAVGPRMAGPTTPDHSAQVRTLAALPDPAGRIRLASAGYGGEILLWEIGTGRPAPAVLAGHTEAVRALVPLPGERLASVSFDESIRLWDLTTREPVAQSTLAGAWFYAMAAVPGTDLLATGDAAGRVRLWDARTLQPREGWLSGHTGEIYAVAALERGGTAVVVSAGQDGVLRWWDANAAAPLGESPAIHTGAVNALAVVPQPDGPALVASAGYDGSILLWNPRTYQPVGDQLTGHTGPVFALAVLPDRQLVSAGGDGTVRLWDLATGQATLVFGEVASVGFADRPARTDALDRRAIATVLTTLLKSAGTNPDEPGKDLPGPTVIAIEGPWGAGKTSLMRFVEQGLPGPAAATDDSRLTVREAERILRAPVPPPPTGTPSWVPAWFNPWAHQSSEQVWAGLTRTIIDGLGAALYPRRADREGYWLARNAERLGARGIRRTMLSRLLSPALRFAPWAVLVPLVARLADPGNQLAWKGHVLLNAATVALLLPVALLVVGLVHTALRYRRGDAATFLPADLLSGPVLSGPHAQPAKDQTEALRDPLYHARSGYLYLYQHDIKRLLDDAGAAGYRLVVFIDDLDRCSPQTTADVLGAVNLFLSEQFRHSRFVVGLDPVVVAAHVDHIFKDVADRQVITHGDDPSPGWTFLRKLIQLPVTLPYVSDGAIDRLLSAELGAVDVELAPAPAGTSGAAASAVAAGTPAAVAAGTPAAAVAGTSAATALVEPAPAAAAEPLPDPTTLTRDLERSPRVRELLTERLRAQPDRSVRETKRLVTAWVYYVRLLALTDPQPPAVSERRARDLVLLAEITSRWPALQRHLNLRLSGSHGLVELVASASDDEAWAGTLRRLGLGADGPGGARVAADGVGADRTDPHRAACDSLRELARAYDLHPVAALAARLS